MLDECHMQHDELLHEISNKLAVIYTEHEVSIGGATVQSYAVRCTVMLVIVQALNSLL